MTTWDRVAVDGTDLVRDSNFKKGTRKFSMFVGTSEAMFAGAYAQEVSFSYKNIVQWIRTRAKAEFSRKAITCTHVHTHKH